MNKSLSRLAFLLAPTFVLGFSSVQPKNGYNVAFASRSLETTSSLSSDRVFSVPRHEAPSFLKATKTSEASNDDVCTIQILMSDTGGGHRASANALRDAFDTLYPGRIQCDIVDIYTDYGPFWPFNDYVNMYKFMAKYPITWDIFYHFGATDFGLWLNEFLLETFCFDSFEKCLARPSGSTPRRADMVISVHPLCQDIPLKILAHLDSKGRTRNPVEGRTTPFCTVVTDLGSAHPTWFHPAVDQCFVPSDALNKAARARGLKGEQIVQYGLPIRKGFWSDGTSKKSSAKSVDAAARKRLRGQLGLDPALPTALVVGGGDGMGGIVSISEELGRKLGQRGGNGGSGGASSQMVVVCGNNQDAKKSLEGVQWGGGVKVLVKGFVNNMDEWMQASDTLVTKAGPGTIAEASICGLPCMMFSYLPGQEAGNIPFVEDAGFGKYSGDATTIAETVSSWLASPDKLESMKDAALNAARPHATLDIAKDLAAVVFAEKQKQEQREPQKVAVRAR